MPQSLRVARPSLSTIVSHSLSISGALKDEPTVRWGDVATHHWSLLARDPSTALAAKRAAAQKPCGQRFSSALAAARAAAAAAASAAASPPPPPLSPPRPRPPPPPAPPPPGAAEVAVRRRCVS